MSITIQPIPLNIRKELSNPHIPLEISKRIYNEMNSQNTKSYKKVQVLPTDPEWHFVWRYFHQDKPNNYNIKKIYCIYEKNQQQTFENNLSCIERETSTFKPTWYQEPRSTQREKAIERWKQSANIFSPFYTMETDRKKKTWKNVKILPLWYGGSEEDCESISQSGFVYSKRTSLEDSASKNEDAVFFGNGIYFTNSARYASDIYSEGHIFLAWVSMGEPFPIVGDDCQTDMKDIKNKGAYKEHNAHYIPITSINPSDPDETIYYPTKENETPHCDEFVVFHKSQTLPRFWLELEVELPYPLSDKPQFVNELIPHLMKLLQNSKIYRDQKLRSYLCKELESLFALEEDDYLEEKHETMYEQLKQILNPKGKINRQVSRILTETQQAITQSTKPSNNLVPTQSLPTKRSKTLPSKPTIKVSPSFLAFGKADWEKYFGDIGEEPPFPRNIEEILNESCPFWPKKKVNETHLLVLVPNTLNGKPFTINYLKEIIQKPKSGHSTKCFIYGECVKKAIGDKSYPSHWVLMTRDVLPPRKKNRHETGDLITYYNKITGLNYEWPHEIDAATSILMHYVKTGEKLFSGNPCTYTYSQDVDEEGNLLVVGGFGCVGLEIRNGIYDFDKSCSRYSFAGVRKC